MTTKVLVTQLTVPQGTPQGQILQVGANNTVTTAVTSSSDEVDSFLLAGM
jgi:hypothetical protein